MNKIRHQSVYDMRYKNESTSSANTGFFETSACPQAPLTVEYNKLTACQHQTDKRISVDVPKTRKRSS